MVFMENLRRNFDRIGGLPLSNVKNPFKCVQLSQPFPLFKTLMTNEINRIFSTVSLFCKKILDATAAIITQTCIQCSFLKLE